MIVVENFGVVLIREGEFDIVPGSGVETGGAAQQLERNQTAPFVNGLRIYYGAVHGPNRSRNKKCIHRELSNHLHRRGDGAARAPADPYTGDFPLSCARGLGCTRRGIVHYCNADKEGS